MTFFQWRCYVGILVVCFFFGCDQKQAQTPQDLQFSPRVSVVSEDEKALLAFHNHQSGIFIEANGIVARVLEDDLSGPRHQRFIVRLNSGQTLLVTHNIDVAQRIADLGTGTRILFRGQYEWNEKGGVIHWTHHDPSGKRGGGWVEYKGKRYE